MTHIILLFAIFFRTCTDLSFKLAVTDVHFTSFKTLGPNLKKLFSTPFVWSGILFAMLNLGVWCLSLGNFDLSYAYPLFSIHYIAMILAGKFFFKEKLDRSKLIGIGFIGAGVILLFTS